MQKNNYLLRSMMFVPGHNEKLLLSASKSNADALILDVEDSVLPISNKKIAREKIKEKVSSGLFNKFGIFPRVNDKESGFLMKDLQSLTIEGVDGFVYPKVNNKQDILFFEKHLREIEVKKGFPKGKFKIVPLIETAAAVLNAQEICLASKRVIAIAFGCEDFVSDLEGIHDKEGKSILVPRAFIALAARATGVIPIDTVHIEVHDLEDLEKNTKLARALGFEGMLILHPKEIEIAHKYFSPSEKEIEDAEKMLQLSKEAEKQNKGVDVSDGRFVGPPMVKMAKKILDRAELIEKKNRGV